MPKINMMPNGVASAFPRVTPIKSGERGEVKGWSKNSARRCDLFLRSVVVPKIMGYPHAYALTLTVRNCPETPKIFAKMVESMFKHLTGLYHWVIEWQERSRTGGGSVPHLHAVIFTDEEPVYRRKMKNGQWWEFRGAEALKFKWFLKVLGASKVKPNAGERVEVYSTVSCTLEAQHIENITDPAGWFRYLSKHAARGIHHYQRAAELPKGWEKTGRMWGHNKGWPLDQVIAKLSEAAFYALRRSVNRVQIEQARREVQLSQCRLGDSRGGRQLRDNQALLRRAESRVKFLRVRYRKAEEKIGRIMPISEWCNPHAVRAWLRVFCIPFERYDLETGEVLEPLYVLKTETEQDTPKWRAWRATQPACRSEFEIPF